MKYELATILEPPCFAVVAVGSCRHCGEPTEQRLIIGWIHVDAFYLCAGHSGDEEEIKRAEPRD